MNTELLIEEQLARGVPLSDILEPTDNIYNFKQRITMPDITGKVKETNPTWKFRSKTVEISDMDERAVASAFIHTMKLSFRYSQKLVFIQDKQEQLAQRAAELGMTLPDSFKEMKEVLHQLKHAEEKPA